MGLISPRFLRGLGISICTLAMAVGGAAAVVAADSAGMPRVRSGHAYIRAMIEEAAAALRHVPPPRQGIEATDGIVYVEQGACGHSVRACLSLNVTAAAEYRILRVMVDARQPDWDVMASIGHELQHALEVLGNAHAQDQRGRVPLLQPPGHVGPTRSKRVRPSRPATPFGTKSDWYARRKLS